jgi:DHA1 family tetracycline resistance protein-like MFS transporter
MHSISWLFVGRILTGFCSGNCALAQSATADLTEPHHRSQAFGILLGVGGLGFVAGPWIGGKLANPLWLSGSGAFLFAMIAALVNFFVVFFFFKETLTKKRKSSQLVSSFKDLRLVFRHQAIGTLLKTNLLFSIGWGFFLIFFPVFLVQKFSLGPNKIGDIFAYMSLIWFFVAMFLNKELVAAFSLRSLVLAGALFSSLGIASFVFSGTLWPYWFLIPIALLGGALGWVNLSSLLSIQTSDSMQGRVMGAAGSTWSVGQILAALIAGPLASWNVYSPLLLGSVCVLCAFFYFLTHDTHPFRK